MRVLRVMVLGVALPLLIVTTTAAQGVQTGEVSGTVSSSDGLTLPGATITAAGPALQGVRTVVADAKGNYVIRALPPGTYKVTFEMSGLSPRSENVVIELGRQTVVNATLALAGVAENVNVTAEVSTAGLTSPAVGANYTATEINQLPTGRTPALIAELAPGLTANTPNSGQVTISGGFAYDNVFMINGVDVNDNLFGSAQPVFIEDAVEQTSVLTSGISAEYGRFSGGVINMITKSGGNTFSGSFRSNLSNNAWTLETPREKAAGNNRRDKLNPSYEATARRTGHPRQTVVLHRGPLAGHEQHRDAPRDQPAVRDDHQGHPLRGQRHGNDCEGPHAAGELHQGYDGPDAPAVRRVDRSECCRAPELSEPALRRELQRHSQQKAARELPGLAEEGRVSRERRVRHRYPRLSVLHDRRRRGRAWRSALQRQLLRRYRPGRPRQLPVRRQPLVLRDHAAGRVARHQGRIRAFQVEPDRWQLAERERLCVRHRLRAG